jgi:hypothetical protein
MGMNPALLWQQHLRLTSFCRSVAMSDNKPLSIDIKKLEEQVDAIWSVYPGWSYAGPIANSASQPPIQSENLKTAMKFETK